MNRRKKNEGKPVTKSGETRLNGEGRSHDENVTH